MDEILAVVVYSLFDALTPVPLVVKFTVSEFTPVNVEDVNALECSFPSYVNELVEAQETVNCFCEIT